MEPRNNSVNNMNLATPEQAVSSVSVENTQNSLQPQESVNSSPEQARTAEQSAGRVDTLPPPLTPLPVVDQSQDVTQPITTNQPSTTAPVTASDGDLIEKEWIDKVKQIISSTSEDPHAQQREVSKLMADYVLKRTGRKIGKDNG